MNPILAIDPEFEAKCPPLTEEELGQLEENILEEGVVLMPLIVWNNTIVDGHNRYKIAMANPGIEFRTHEKVFDSRYEAISWICKNQLGRRNLTPQQKKYLIGERYDAEKKSKGASDGFRGNQYTDLVKDQFDPLPDTHVTRQRIADETGTSQGYVQRAEYYAKGVDAAEEVLPGIKEDILSGTIKPRDTEIAAIARAVPEKRLEMAEKLREPKEKPSSDTKPPNKNHRRQDYAEIDAIYAEMLDQDKTVNEDDILETMQAEVRTMIRVCNTLFKDFPRLLTHQPYKDKVYEIMQEPKNYIIKIEGETK